MEDEFIENEAVKRYHQMISMGEIWYFDIDDICDILSHYIDIYDLDSATTALNLAETQHPESSVILIKKLELLLAKGKVKESKELIYRLFDQEIHNGDFLICIGKYHSLKHQPEKAIAYYKKALKVSDEMAFIYNSMATEYLHMHKINRALYCFKESLRQQPYEEFSFYSIIQCYNEIGRIDACIRFLTQYIDQYPYSEIAWHNIGLQYILNNEYQKAIEAFDYAHLINSENTNSLFQKAACLEIMEEYEIALKTYQEILQYEEQNATVNYRIGECYTLMRKHAKAAQYFTKASYLDPQLDKAWFALSLAQEKLNNFPEAKYAISRALDLLGDNVDYLRQSAYINIELTCYEEAAGDYAKITDLEPDNFYSWFARSELLITLGELDAAIQVLKQSLLYLKKNASLHYQLSYCYFLIKNTDLGQKHIEIAKTINHNIVVEMEKKYPHFEERSKLMLK